MLRKYVGRSLSVLAITPYVSLVTLGVTVVVWREGVALSVVRDASILILSRRSALARSNGGKITYNHGDLKYLRSPCL